MKAVHDPETFLLCNKPRPLADAKASVKAFIEELRELRAKHRIGNVYVLAEVMIDGEPPETRVAIAHIGDTSRSLDLAAYAHGYERKLHDARTRKAVQVGMAAAAETLGEDAGEAQP